MLPKRKTVVHSLRAHARCPAQGVKQDLFVVCQQCSEPLTLMNRGIGKHVIGCTTNQYVQGETHHV